MTSGSDFAVSVMPWPQSSTASLLPSFSAIDWPRGLSLTMPLRPLFTGLISHTGTCLFGPQ